jgi:hypothetical protein
VELFFSKTVQCKAWGHGRDLINHPNLSEKSGHFRPFSTIVAKPESQSRDGSSSNSSSSSSNCAQNQMRKKKWNSKAGGGRGGRD